MRAQTIILRRLEILQRQEVGNALLGGSEAWASGINVRTLARLAESVRRDRHQPDEQLPPHNERIERIDLISESGAVYRFNIVEYLPFSGGHFLYAREGSEGYTVIYVDESDDLAASVFSHWPEAVKDYGATEVFVRVSASEKRRKAEFKQIMDSLKPPMNEHRARRRAG